MGLLLRKISLNKWKGNINKPPSNYSADAITGCTRTTSNTLSVWSSCTPNFDDEKVKELIVGLALSMPQPAKIDLIWLDEDKLKSRGLQIKSTEANSVYTSINSRHKDIEGLDHEKLGIVGQHIVEQFTIPENVNSIAKNKLVKLVIEWMKKENTFSLDDLNEKWLEEVNKKL
ncbi:hypothetical protein [Oceanisphaera sp. W20_SRM_FM3]|uniref:hypothetical protein n=1 Tax=Oceanisphaera sp. W20_SRM_FM3 TaxID=3240267 RepID=UPI003F97FAE6